MQIASEVRKVRAGYHSYRIYRVDTDETIKTETVPGSRAIAQGYASRWMKHAEIMTRRNTTAS